MKGNLKKPLVCFALLRTATKMDNGGYGDAEKWYCYLPPGAYAQLFRVISS